MSNNLFVGKVCYRFDELPSTNDWALELLAAKDFPPLGGTAQTAAKTKPPEGTVVRADNQTAGRGQLGSRWQSERGQNLLMSVIFYPNWLEAQAQFCLSMAVALALRDCATAMLGPSGISVKWPNDLYVGDRKTAGILIQNALSGERLQSSVVGIGLNVNQTQFPPELPNATSLALAAGREMDLEQVAGLLFSALEQRYLQLKSGQRAALKAEYERCLWRLGELVALVRHVDGSLFEGRILGVTEQGLLRVWVGEGEERFGLKEVGPA